MDGVAIQINMLPVRKKGRMRELKNKGGVDVRGR